MQESLAAHPQGVALDRARTLPWYVTAMAFAATSIVVGVIWDISGHQTIGRDTFWTPAHIAIYLGGVLAGICGGYLAIRTTFWGTEDERQRGVAYWGFRAPLGAWLASWGGMRGLGFVLTSHAPNGVTTIALRDLRTDQLLRGFLFAPHRQPPR